MVYAALLLEAGGLDVRKPLVLGFCFIKAETEGQVSAVRGVFGRRDVSGF